ncbi:MAG: hypothetical protein JWO51_2751 [Rhodospirillales bacterium]|nr:hypothetical protein [Rhodospirillales bacterium]
MVFSTVLIPSDPDENYRPTTEMTSPPRGYRASYRRMILWAGYLGTELT